MSESTKKSDNNPQPETQKQRWIKYGGNVVLTVVVVIVLAILVVAIAQRSNARLDTTASGVYSLKPQTVNIIKDLKEPIKLVSLYIRPERRAQDDAESVDYAQTVADLLEEYEQKGKNITIDVIDPVQDPAKEDALYNEIISKYGQELTQYKSFLEKFDGEYEQLRKLLADGAVAVQDLQTDQLGRGETGQILSAVIDTIRRAPEELARTKEDIDRARGQKRPDYKGLVDAAKEALDTVSQRQSAIGQFAEKYKADASVPEPVRNYLAASVTRHKAIEEKAQSLIGEIDKLGEVKVDSLRDTLERTQNPILVLGEDDWRVISFNQVWQIDPEIRETGEVKPQFAGEQQISTAILSLTSERKPKVVFIRPGGAPLTTPGFPPFQPSGPLSRIAQRLRSYNFEVLEKDLSGQWAMQAQMRGMPAEPEPSDEEIKDAIWVVLSVPTPQMGPMQPPTDIGPKVAEHLKNGGSVLAMFLPESDDLSAALDEWGIDVKTDVVAVHEKVETAGAQGTMLEEAKRVPFIFVINDYGDHLVTEPLRSLDSLLVPLMAVETQTKDGIKTTPILPVPQVPPSWGERDLQTALQNGPVKFNSSIDGTGDIPAPIFGGAVAEKADGTGARVVAIGSLQFITNPMLTMNDPELLRQGIPVALFPGNSELFMNSIFWLAHMETMIAISPAAMDVARIEPMSPGTLNAWRIGLVLVGIPVAVIACGGLVYFLRRD